MKTYFLSWQCDNLRGHLTAEVSDDVKPSEALGKMLDAVKERYAGVYKGLIFATQFNNVT